MSTNQRILLRRMSQKWSEYAKRVNKPRSTIVRIENATMEPSVSLVNEIAATLQKQVIVKIVDRDKQVKL